MAQVNQEKHLKLSKEEIYYIVNHVFLPPRLPQQDDYKVEHEDNLLKAVIQVLAKFKEHVQDDVAGVVDLITVSIQTLHQSSAFSPTPSEKQLLEAFKRLLQKDGTLVLHIRAQNAGVMFTRSGTTIQVEMFELSPRNESVVSTEGRLRRVFPGSAVAIPLSTFQLLEFRATVASTLTKMSAQRAYDTKPRVKKSNKMHDEDRDTTHPKMITELFSAFLLSVGSPVEVAGLRKNTRDEVFWKDSLLPWRRSALWLLIRVALQLQFSRSGTSSKCPDQIYKTFMLFFMANILTQAHDFNLPSDLLSAMNAKISRRCQKIVEFVPHTILDFVRSTISTTNRTLQERWTGIQKEDHVSHDLKRLQSLKFEHDTDVCLSKLDNFINSLYNRGKSNDISTVKLNSPLQSYAASEIPSWEPTSDVVYMTYQLAAFETWVALNLTEWSMRKEGDSRTSGVLRQLIESYHEAALKRYKGNPELMSTMILTILELWVASDKSAVRVCKLLAEYKSGIPLELLGNLNLPLKEQMERLLKVERYLKHRSSCAKLSFYDVFHNFGQRTSFSVQYFEQSTEHQALLATIESAALRDRNAKREEFRQMRNRYRNLMRRSEETEHQLEITTDSTTGLYSERCTYNCAKCQLVQEANGMGIHIHEWPLPENEYAAKSTVFELRVPRSFGHWRDTTAFVLLNVLESRYQVEKVPRADYTLSRSYLNSHFQKFDSRQRITLLSEDKPHTRTHRSIKDIITKTEDDVCLQTGLHFMYYDSEKGRFVVPFETTQSISTLCTYTVPGHPPGNRSPIQQFIHRPTAEPSGPSPNTVLATQSACPSNLSLEEYKALTSIPLGYNIQWQNILVQLTLPSIDFRKEETAIVILQCIFQAGPCGSDNVLRDSHIILSDAHFAHALLGGLYEGLHRVEENWQSFQALGTFISIARRLLSFTPADDVRTKCLEFLTETREVALRWIEVLEDQIQCTADDDTRADLRYKVTKVALICADTFNVDDEHLRGLLGTPDQACTMLRCAIIIREGLHCIPGRAEDLTSIMHRRWERLAYRGFSILANEMINRKSPALNNAIKASWSAFQPAGNWLVMKAPYDHWVQGSSAPGSGSGSLVVHFSLLTGELLINGSPLSRLPGEYERHFMYSILIGKSMLEVVPSSVPGMRFSSKKAFNEHHLDFGFDVSGQNLFIRAVNKGKAFELIPRQVLEDSFPTMFVDDYVHWYNSAEGYIEFCSQELPWCHSERNWRLIRSPATSSRWRLVKGNSSLLDIHSRTVTEVTKILRPIEEPAWIHNILHGTSLDIELPRLKLGFYLRQGGTSILSRQFRGMSVDRDQSIGTLIGLHSKLVLKGDNRRTQRKVIIPSGSVVFNKKGQHVDVHIGNSSTTKVHAYDIDDLLGRLANNSSLQSKLLISYLHALTSSPLPDPLTGKTGTEQALVNLNCSAVRSFKWLTQEDIDMLINIASITPGRVYYPANERVMQTVEWSTRLNFLAQHGEFYQTVRSIFDQAEKSKFFYPEWYVEPPPLHDVKQSLLHRDLIRSATFRVSGFGAENYTAKFDVDYKARDREKHSVQASQAFAISSKVFRGDFSLHKTAKGGLDTQIWNFLSLKTDYIHGYNHNLPVSELKYDAGLLLDSSPFIAQNWLPLHRVLSTETIRPKRFQMMFWLATLSYAKQADTTIIEVLASFYAVPKMASVIAPHFDRFVPRSGFRVHESSLTKILRPACLPFSRSPEASLAKDRGESNKAFQARRSKLYQSNKDRALSSLVSTLRVQWPCETPTRPASTTVEELRKHINIDHAMKLAAPEFKQRFRNHELVQYLNRINDTAPWSNTPVQIPQYSFKDPPQGCTRRSGFIKDDDIFSLPAPTPAPHIADEPISLARVESKQTFRLPSLLSRLDIQARSGYEMNYVANLRSSIESLQVWMNEHHWESEHLPKSTTREIETLLDSHRRTCQEAVDRAYAAMHRAVETGLQVLSASSQQWPRLSPMFFLQRLSRRYWRTLSEDWKRCIVDYGVLVTKLQRAERLLRAVKSPSALINEVRNSGHINWQPRDHPESLLLEIESDILIRPVQQQIAMAMRSPEAGRNAVMQLNMGEGKSSVIVPMVAAALADGSRLVRVIVGKPQSKQMYQMLVSKLGGMLHRRVYHMPFSRAVKVGHEEISAMREMFASCKETGGVFLVQPEHILSFRLMGIECILREKEDIAHSLVRAEDFLNKHTRDIVDESDENFSVKFELVYTMGTQRPTEHSPHRWVCIQQVLEIIRQIVSKVYSELHSSIELHFQSPGCFPQTRILQQDAADRILTQIAEYICNRGLINGFPIARQPTNIREAVHRYIVEVNPEAAEVGLVEDQRPGGFWTSVSQTLLLLRGLIAGGVLAFAFGHKRWRVDYGLDANRQPATKLAVPYRAKDNPSPRSEFSHPDVVIILTSLSYYYGGLNDEDLFQAFEHLLKSDQADLEYQTWVRDANGLSPAFRQLIGINLEDKNCIQQVFKSLRYAKGAIDYFLAHIVFPKEMKEFPHKLSASGWDIGEVKSHPTTGFSGTNDSRKVLPLDVKQLDLEAQKHTNALVLENLLRPENSVELMPPRREKDGSIAEMLLDIITKMDPPTRVILDVGAQILELDNLGVAQAWLNRISDTKGTQAAIFFDDNDELCVLDRQGHFEPLQTSSFASQLDVCLVFLDEAHTRGIDLKLPRNYRAAVTLGANLTKDRLVQACMRMRMLGGGQSVVFCVPQEIQKKIQAARSAIELGTDCDISVSDILCWSIGETWRDIHRSMALWASQGRRHQQHKMIWADARSKGKMNFTKALAKEYLEEEARTLEYRYRPHNSERMTGLGQDESGEATDPISIRCREFEKVKLDSAALQEEEERELSPEIEQERQDEKPPQATPAVHSIHGDIKAFVSSGIIKEKAVGYVPAFSALGNTSAGALFDVSQFQPRLLVSDDFARTIRSRGASTLLDSYERSVQWILTSGSASDEGSADSTIKHMMVISPYEAQQLLPTIQQSKIVALHIYAPRPNLGYRRLDTLDLYTVPERLKARQIPQRLITELNLFAGQLYFDSFEQYVDACKFLGVSRDTPGEGEEIAADGFILRDSAGRVGGESGLRSSPVAFFKLLHTKIRRNCESIDKTHMGKLLDNQLLREKDFEN
ncbi:hypothetical protein F5Y13DRAFT_200276 [Hypoxylon sp. FL1857]|nr:hypothetical protein F5Y13DRAFT_200276 [Hypoxylon sp. FL1857]